MISIKAIKVFIANTSKPQWGTSGLTECGIIQNQSLVKHLLIYCMFHLFNRVNGCAVTDYVNLLFLYITGVFSKHVNSWVW